VLPEGLTTHPLEPQGFWNRFFYRFCRIVCGGYLNLFCRFSVSGPSPPDEGPFIIAANHESHLDPVILQIAVRKRRLHYMMTTLFYYTPHLNLFSNIMRCIPIKNNGMNREGLRLAIEVLKAGRPIGIFPEGERRVMGDVGEGFKGVAFLARKSGVPVIPARIRGSGQALPKGATAISPSRISINLGAPLDFTASKGSISLDEIRDIIMSSIRNL